MPSVREDVPDAGVTRMLRQAQAGDREAAAELYTAVSEQLRAIAARHMRHERPGHTLQATALVDEAYMRLVDAANIEWRGRAHFYAVASRAIRNILIAHARRKARSKRGGGWRRIEMDDAVVGTPGRTVVDVLELDDALHRLSELSQRQAQVVELRFFGGLSVQEAAEVLGVSPRTVEGDWSIARAWLRRELGGDRPDGDGG